MHERCCQKRLPPSRPAWRQKTNAPLLKDLCKSTTDSLDPLNSPSECKDDRQQWDELQVLLTQVHRHDNQLQKVDEEQGDGVGDEESVDSDILKLHPLQLLIKQRPKCT